PQALASGATGGKTVFKTSAEVRHAGTAVDREHVHPSLGAAAAVGGEQDFPTASRVANEIGGQFSRDDPYAAGIGLIQLLDFCQSLGRSPSFADLTDVGHRDHNMTGHATTTSTA
ncbi:MAG: hypothetical protein JWN40_2349, partial [Phycisphaerales bacterium]|nr:hypothetical protein [Phycisphaerales bacterium]